MSADLTQRLRNYTQCTDSDIDEAADELDARQATIDEQRRTIDALMVGMPDDGTTPVIRRIAALEQERDALRARIAEAEGQELWVPVVGFEELYEVSSFGNIRNSVTKLELAKNSTGCGYVKADLWKNGKRKQTSAHRVVAEAFIGPINGNEVNHKNGIKTDNRPKNLEIVTRSENEKHSRKVLGNLCKPIYAKNIETGEELFFWSIEEAGRNGFHPTAIYNCIRGNKKTHKGHTFMFARPIPAPAAGVPNRCEYCDGTGDVTGIDGEWRGYCVCQAGQALKLSALNPANSKETCDG